MDSYTDVSTQCCGCGRMSCGSSCGNGCGSCTRPDYPDMNTFPWNSWESDPELSYPTPAAPYPSAAPFPSSTPYPPAPNMTCPSTEQGALEQQYPVAMAYVPWQQWQTTYAPERGLVQGTIFPELDLQFNYGRCGR